MRLGTKLPYVLKWLALTLLVISHIGSTLAQSAPDQTNPTRKPAAEAAAKPTSQLVGNPASTQRPANREISIDARQMNPNISGYRFTIPSTETVSVPNFFTRFARNLGLSSNDQMETHTVRQPTQVASCRTVPFQQLYRHIPVLHADYVVVECRGSVLNGVGMIAEGLNLSVEPRLTAAEATKVALKMLDARENRVRNHKFTLLKVWVPDFTRPVTARLVYHVSVGNLQMLVDAQNGKLLMRRSSDRHAWSDVPAVGTGLYQPSPVSFVAQSDELGTHRLASVQPKVWTFNILTQSVGVDQLLVNGVSVTYSDLYSIVPEDITSATSSFADPTQALAVEAHWSTQQTLAYLLNVHGWNGLDNNGAGVPIAINLTYGPVPAATCPGDGMATTDAAWLTPDDPIPGFGTGVLALNGGDCLGSPPNTCNTYGLAHPEVVGHEIAHGIAHQVYQGGFWGGLLHSQEAGPLGESYSDILGVLVEAYVAGTDSDWQIKGLPVFVNGKERRFDDPQQSDPKQPNMYPQPNQPLPPYWITSTHPCADPHINAGVHNHQFYLLATGAPPDLIGIGTDKAASIAMLTLTSLLNSAPTHQLARDAEIAGATVLFGSHSQPVASVTNAWAAVGVGSPYVNPLHYIPADGAIDVAPWPTAMSWQALFDEIEWQIEISENPDFSSNIISRSVSPTGPPPSLIQLPQNLRPHLKPDTTYYWRVRGRHDPAVSWQDWRVVVSFHTAKQTTTLLSPIERESEQHPWELPFKWTSVKGANAYEVQVALKPNNGPPTWQDLVVTSSPKTTEKTLNVRVAKIHSWRVRTIGATTDVKDNTSEWSAVATFITSLPVVELVNPINNAKPGPWPTTFYWKSVRGAQYYLLDVTECDGIYKYQFENQQIPCELSSPTGVYEPHKVEHDDSIDVYEFALNFKPEWLQDIVRYNWQVRVVGPTPLEEEGGVPDNGSWIVNGDVTIPKKIAPSSSPGPHPVDCIEVGDNVKFVWSTVHNAVNYRLIVDEAMKPDPQTDVFELGSNRFDQWFPHDPDSPEQSLSVELSEPVTGPMANDKHVGHFWRVQTIGPDGLRGLLPKAGVFFPTITAEPDLVTPDNKKFPPSLSHNTILEWKSAHAPFGQYYLEVYRSNFCEWGALPTQLVISAPITGTSPGGGSASLNVMLGSGDPSFSWRTKGYFGMDPPICGVPAWSKCRQFSFGESCGNDVKETGEDCDDGNNTDGDTCPADCKFPKLPPPSGIQARHGSSTVSVLTNLLIEWEEVPDAYKYRLQYKEIGMATIPVDHFAPPPNQTQMIYAAACSINSECLGLDPNKWIVGVIAEPKSSGIDYELRLSSCTEEGNCGGYTVWMPVTSPTDYETDGAF